MSEFLLGAYMGGLVAVLCLLMRAVQNGELKEVAANLRPYVSRPEVAISLILAVAVVLWPVWAIRVASSKPKEPKS